MKRVDRAYDNLTMQPIFRPILRCAWLACVAVCAPNLCEAGFVFSAAGEGIDPFGTKAVVFVESASSSSATTGEFVAEEKARREAAEVAEVAFGEWQSDESGMQAPGGASSAAGGVMYATALVDNAISRPVELVQRLDLVEEVWVPPGFLSGVFRPPREFGHGVLV
jgi:hypothetical protein